MQTPTGRTRGQLEAAVSQAVILFKCELTGRGPLDVRTYLLDDVALVRLRGVLTVPEQRLAASPQRGHPLLRQLWQELLEQGRPRLEQAVGEALGVAVRGVYADVNTATNEGLIVMTLEARPGAGEVTERPADRGAERGLPSR
jgi:uncharacterized protein YbcI